MGRAEGKRKSEFQVNFRNGLNSPRIALLYLLTRIFISGMFLSALSKIPPPSPQKNEISDLALPLASPIENFQKARR